MRGRPDAAANVPPDYTALTFGAAPSDRPYVIVNMVSSFDGRAVIEGSERGLGSNVDQRLMRELRFHADVVLDGAETLRTSGISPRLDDPALETRRAAMGRSKMPIAATISRSGRLPLQHAFFTARDFDAVVYLSASAPPAQREAIRAAGRTVVTLPMGDEIRTMLHHMRADLRAELLLLEGGPAMTGAFFEHGVIDEFFLTLGGMIVGGADPKTVVQSKRPATVAGIGRFDLQSAAPNMASGEVYLRYRRAQTTAGG